MLFTTPRRRRATWAALALALALLVWLIWPDRNLARVRALQQELFGEAGRALPPEERQARFAELRTATQKLSSAQRQELAQDGMRRQQDEMARYFQLSPVQKRQYLDQQINRQEEARRRMQQQPAAGNRPAGGPGGPGGFARGPGGRGDRSPPTAQERERRRQMMLDRTTPVQRAHRDQFRKDMELRRQQRGLPPTPPGFGRRGR
jgi:hypothetical protein